MNTPLPPAPDFSLPDQHDTIRQLSDYAGKWLVIYFYPKDDTPGCTAEACQFRDEREAIAQFGQAEIIGVSKDTVGSHRRFAEKHSLNFSLLSDRDHVMTEAYGAWGPKKFMGRDFFGTKRNTVLVTPDGRIAKVYEGVDPRHHAAEIIADLKVLQQRT
jgi:peroxiredoxin Q/BCP